MLKKFFIRFCEFLLILLIFVGLTFSVTFYRLHKAPLNVNFALETIESALADDVRGLSTNVLEASLFWPDMKGPILLLLDDVHILRNGEERFSLDRAAVSIARLPLLAGKVKPEAVILEGTSLQLIRDENNEVRVALDFDNLDEVNTKQTQAVDPFSILAAVLSGDPNNDPLFGLKAFEIRNSKIFVEDQNQQKTWSIPDFSVVFTRSDKEIDVDLSYMMKGQIQRTDAGFTLGLSNSDSSFYTAKFHFQNFDPALFGNAIGFKSVQGRGLLLEGQSSVNISKDWKILTADVGIKSASGQLNIEGLYGDRYLDVARVSLDVGYDADGGAVSLRQLSMDVQDVSLVISSEVTLDDRLITVPIKISGKDIEVDDIGVIFPDALKGTIAEEWGRKNLSVGTIKEVTVSVPLSFSPDGNGVWITSVGAVESDFTFENMTVDYSTPLMPAVGVDGFGSFRDDDLTIEAIKGHIKDLTTNKVRVVISDLSVAGGGMADI
ncbi:MAG: hypothetical protein JKY11_03250, partial [Alphaproteobacteria bacterium]|nr:hypothetical protein [Alphaproteobacteria bacterium]